MGSYITQEDFEDRVGLSELQDLIGDETNYAAKVAKIIAYAEGRFNGYAYRLYSLPVPASPAVQDLVLCVAEYRVHFLAQSGNVPQKYKDAYDDATKTMIDMAKGDYVPPPDDTGAVAAIKVTTGMSMDLTTDTPLFTEEKFNGTCATTGCSCGCDDNW